MKRLIYLLLILTIFIGTMPEKSYGEVDYVDFIDVKIESNKEYNEIIKLYSEDGFNLYDRLNKNISIFKINYWSVTGVQTCALPIL